MASAAAAASRAGKRDLSHVAFVGETDVIKSVCDALDAVAERRYEELLADVERAREQYVLIAQSAGRSPAPHRGRGRPNTEPMASVIKSSMHAPQGPQFWQLRNLKKAIEADPRSADPKRILGSVASLGFTATGVSALAKSEDGFPADEALKQVAGQSREEFVKVLGDAPWTSSADLRYQPAHVTLAAAKAVDSQAKHAEDLVMVTGKERRFPLSAYLSSQLKFVAGGCFTLGQYCLIGGDSGSWNDLVGKVRDECGVRLDEIADFSEQEQTALRQDSLFAGVPFYVRMQDGGDRSNFVDKVAILIVSDAAREQIVDHCAEDAHKGPTAGASEPAPAPVAAANDDYDDFDDYAW